MPPLAPVTKTTRFSSPDSMLDSTFNKVANAARYLLDHGTSLVVPTTPSSSRRRPRTAEGDSVSEGDSA